MWWALAAAAIPYVMQQMQGQPQQPRTPGMVLPPDRTNYNNALLDNAFNPHAEIFQRSSDAVAENVNRMLGKTGMGGSSGGAQAQTGLQSALAAKWLEDQTSRQRMALNAVNSDEGARASLLNEFNNQQYGYGAARYNRDNIYNSSQIAGVGGMLSAGASAYGQNRTDNRLDQNALAYQSMMSRMQPPTRGGYGTQMGDPGSAGYAGDPYSNALGTYNYTSPDGY